jgi:hypothetical protein
MSAQRRGELVDLSVDGDESGLEKSGSVKAAIGAKAT